VVRLTPDRRRHSGYAGAPALCQKRKWFSQRRTASYSDPYKRVGFLQHAPPYFLVIIGAPLTLIIVGGGQLFPCPQYAISSRPCGIYPIDWPALATNGQVHYQPSAEDYARDVAALLRTPSRGLKPCMVAASRIL